MQSKIFEIADDTVLYPLFGHAHLSVSHAAVILAGLDSDPLHH
jgi:hypothetical protein